MIHAKAEIADALSHAHFLGIHFPERAVGEFEIVNRTERLAEIRNGVDCQIRVCPV